MEMTKQELQDLILGAIQKHAEKGFGADYVKGFVDGMTYVVEEFMKAQSEEPDKNNI